MTKKFYTIKKNLTKKKIIISLALGLVIGFVNGFFGGGGGMIVVPLLCCVLGLKDKNAHATAILIILPLCIVSAGIYIMNGTFELLPTLFTALGAVIGGIMGALLLKKLSNKTIRFIFSLIMVVAGLKLIF